MPELKKIHSLLNEPLQVINIGLQNFAHAIDQQENIVIQLNWSPPAGGDPELAEILSKLGV